MSYIIRGRLSDFSVERLMGFLTALGLDVEIVLRKTPKSRKQRRLRVRTG